MEEGGYVNRDKIKKRAIFFYFFNLLYWVGRLYFCDWLENEEK